VEAQQESAAPRGPRLVVGLGNPGAKYAGTRHNVGFDVLDLYARRLQREPKSFPDTGQTLADAIVAADESFVLLWPLTYMNLSGRAVVAALRHFEADPAQILVVTDDFHLPLGALRVRASGSCGGHNGLRSISASLGDSDDYPRLRIGVGEPRDSTVDFVLDTFRAAEEPIIEETLETCSWAAEDWAKGASIEDLQARYNRRKPQA
jgi:peptidyl-tRNA hydrolase, PTH1 family